MKKTLIAIAAGTMLAAPMLAQADTKVYGRFNIGLESKKNELGIGAGGADNHFRVQDQNNSSRLGFKGEEDLGVAGLKAIYQLEYGIDPWGSEGSAFSARNIYVGLQGGFGTVRLGKFDTPVKDAGAKVDLFNDESIGDITSLMRGESRVNDIIQYTTPKIADALTFNVAIIPGQERVASDNANDIEDGLFDTFYVSAEYATKMVNVQLAYAGNERSSMLIDGASIGIDIIRAAVQVKPIKQLELGLLYQIASGIDQANAVTGTPPAPNPALLTAGDREEKSLVVSVGYSIGDGKIKAQYGQTDGDVSDNKRTMYGLGYDYKISKALTTQVYYIGYDQDFLGANNDPKTTAAGVGLVYSF